MPFQNHTTTKVLHASHTTDAEGKQVLGRFVTVDNYTYYLDPKTGEKYTNRSVLIDGKLYTFDKDGHVVS